MDLAKLAERYAADAVALASAADGATDLEHARRLRHLSISLEGVADAARAAAETFRGVNCETCGERPATCEVDGYTMCAPCWRAALSHGHENVGHDEPIPGCPDCPGEGVA